MKKTKDLPFTWENLQKELDSYRPKTITTKTLSQDQRDFLVQGRTGTPPIPYPKMAELWEKLGWGKTSDMSMRNLYDSVKNGR